MNLRTFTICAFLRCGSSFTFPRRQRTMERSGMQGWVDVSIWFDIRWTACIDCVDRLWNGLGLWFLFLERNHYTVLMVVVVEKLQKDSHSWLLLVVLQTTRNKVRTTDWGGGKWMKVNYLYIQQVECLAFGRVSLHLINIRNWYFQNLINGPRKWTTERMWHIQ